MYRLTFWLVVWLRAAAAAPQDAAPAFVDIQPIVSDERADAASLEASFGGAAPGAAGSDSDEVVRNARQDYVTELDDADTTETVELDAETEVITSPRTTSTLRTFTRPARPTKPSPRFISKLSYFDKPSVLAAISPNLVEKYDKSTRKFVSSCRCEKIWNCQKLQISVPRCPDEYFLCCA